MKKSGLLLALAGIALGCVANHFEPMSFSTFFTIQFSGAIIGFGGSLIGWSWNGND